MIKEDSLNKNLYQEAKMTYAPQIISMNDTTRYNFFYQNSLLHKFIDNDERKTTQDLCSKNIKDLTKDQLLKILYVDGDPQKGKNHVYPFILVRNNGKDIPYPMELIAQKRNDLFSIYKEYINGFLDDINKQITRSGIPHIESIEELLYDQDKNNLCHIAAKVNNAEAIDIFPHWMTEEPDCNGNIPIYVAASYGNKEVAVSLFKGRTNKIFNRDEETPARIAIKNKQIDTALALIEAGDQVFLAHSRYEKNEILKEWLTSLYPDNEQAFVRTFQQLLQVQETTMKCTLRTHREYLEGIGIHPLSVQIEQTKNKKSSSDNSVMSKEPQTPVTSMMNGTEEPALQADSKPKVETTSSQPKNSIMKTVTPKQQSQEQEN